MPWMIVTDEECMELLDGAAEMASAALAARSRRVDQDGALKRSVDMSRVKLETLRASMHTAPLGAFSDLATVDQQAVFRLMKMLMAVEGEGQQNAIWKTLRAYMLRPGTEKPFSGGVRPWSDGDLSKPRVAASPAGSAENAPAVPVRVRKRRKGDTSPNATG